MPRKSTEKRTTKSKGRQQKLEALNITVFKSSAKSKTKSPLTKDRLSVGEYELKKYGRKLPTSEEIRAEHEEFDLYKAAVEDLKKSMDEELPDYKKFNVKKSKKKANKGVDLNCRHLSVAKIEEYFNKFTNTLKDIMTETIFSDRHKRFHTNNSTLTYCTSTVVFTTRQIHKMLDLMRESFDVEIKSLDYFYKVLTPELCLLIFMDECNIDREEAVKYLDQRPLDPDLF